MGPVHRPAGGRAARHLVHLRQGQHGGVVHGAVEPRVDQPRRPAIVYRHAVSDDRTGARPAVESRSWCSIAQVGQATIEFGDDAHALLNYTIDGAGAVKQVSRFTFAPNSILGSYIGATQDVTLRLQGSDAQRPRDHRPGPVHDHAEPGRLRAQVPDVRSHQRRLPAVRPDRPRSTRSTTARAASPARSSSPASCPRRAASRARTPDATRRARSAATSAA